MRAEMKFMKKGIVMLVAVGACLLALSASANTITYTTPSGATESGGSPVSASATFVTGPGTVTITLANLLANPKNIAQCISDLSFVLGGGQTSGSLASSSGTQRFVAADGTWTTGSTGSTGWGVDAGTLHLTALGFSGPAYLIIGPPDGSGVYSAGNSSFAGNGPHNPLLGLSAIFTLNITGVTEGSTVTGATFSFGTTVGNNVTVGRPPNEVPDGGATVLLLGAALSGLGLIRRLRS
jgi:hypothetical protein